MCISVLGHMLRHGCGDPVIWTAGATGSRRKRSCRVRVLYCLG